jgi:hypothetical protein
LLCAGTDPFADAETQSARVTKAQLTKELSEMETALWNGFKNKDIKPFNEHLGADALSLTAPV